MNAVDDSHFQGMKQHYTEHEIAKIFAVIAPFDFLSRWNDTSRTEIEDIHAI